MTAVIVAMLAMLLDGWLGEPRRGHPLMAFGRLARWLEACLHADSRLRGVAAWCLAVLPLAAMSWAAVHYARAVSPLLSTLIGAGLLYLTLGHRSLGEHARPVADALENQRLDAARQAVAHVVSRDTQSLSATQVAAAATESVLENGNDAVFGALFWFFVLGAPGAVLYRLANTLDAMWGYRTARYERFGWAAARIDDALNYVPARLTALTYAAFGDATRAMRCWRTQASAWKSPNAGPVMAAGAGALGVRLGGPAPYRGVWETRPVLGYGADPDADAIHRALRLVRNGVVLWLAVALLLAAGLAGGSP